MQPATGHRSKINVKGIHSVFTGLYTLVAAFFLGVGTIGVGFEIAFQCSLMSFAIGVAFLMFSVTMIGKEICLTRGEFYILARHIIGIVFCAFACIFFSTYYIWNIVNILLLCPHAQPHPNTTTLSVASHTQNLLSIAQLDKALQPTSLTEDQAFQLARAAKICRNEKGFALLMLLVVVLTDILNVITIFVYLWLRRKLRRPCKPCVVPLVTC